MAKDTLLITDDIDINREMLKFIFSEQFRILEAANGDDAIRLLDEEQDRIVLVFLDLIMPGKNGLDVMEHMVQKGYMDYIPVIVITGEATAETDEKAYEYGASDIIYKPFEPKVVMRRTMNIIELFQHRSSLEAELEKRTKELRRSREELKQNNEFLMNALSFIMEYRGSDSSEHLFRIKYYTGVMIKYMREYFPECGLTEEDEEMIVNASALYDIGKIALPDSILLKKGELTKNEEYEFKKHTKYGCEILEHFQMEDSAFYRYCYDICRYHHERTDGSGYPEHLTGDDIPIWAQIVGIVDVFDDLVSRKAYREAYAVADAGNMIIKGEFGTFSDKVMECFSLAKINLYKAADMDFSYTDSVSTRK